ncbi:MAG: cell division protein CrgA [Actinomycetales bacterium]
MPESRSRKKAEYTPPPKAAKKKGPSGPVFLWTMVAAYVIGLAWIVTFYVSSSKYPIPLGDTTSQYWNLGIGFGIICVGFFMSTRWR